MNAVVVQHRTVNAQPVAAAVLYCRAIASDPHALAGLNWLAAQIHFEKGRFGRILQNEFSSRRVRP